MNYVNRLRAQSARPRVNLASYRSQPRLNFYTSARTGRLNRPAMKFSLDQRSQNIAQINQIIQRDYHTYTPQQQRILKAEYAKMMRQYTADYQAYNAYPEYAAHVPRIMPGLAENAGYGRIQARVNLNTGLVTFTGFQSQRSRMDFYNHLGIRPGQRSVPFTPDLYQRLKNFRPSSSYESRTRYVYSTQQRRDYRANRFHALQTVRQYHRNRGIAKYQSRSRTALQDRYAALRSPSTYSTGHNAYSYIRRS